MDKKERVKTKILDLGCGDGLTSFYLSLKENVEVIGVDLNVEEAKEKFPHIKFISSSAEDLPFEDNFFDEIYCFDVLEHVDDIDKTLSEVSRVLKSRGELIAEVPSAKSEEFLLRIRPNYHKEIHHQRIFYPGQLEKKLKDEFELIKRKKMRGIDNLKLYLLFKKDIEIVNQQGDFANPNSFFRESFYLLFKRDLFKTRLKWFFPVWFITFPPGLLINQFFPKTIHFLFRKK